jgi:chaperonin cofactor prefoldin
METIKDIYSIKYTINETNFKINIFNQINNKHYESTKIINYSKLCTDGINIYEIILQSFCDDTYEISELTHDLVITFICGYVMINVECSNIILQLDDVTTLTLKIDKLEKQLEKRDTYIDTMLRRITKYVNICGYTVNRYKQHLIILDKYDDNESDDNKFKTYFPILCCDKPYVYHIDTSYYGMYSTLGTGHTYQPMRTETNSTHTYTPFTIFTNNIDIDDILLVENNELTLINVNIINFSLLSEFKGNILSIFNCSTNVSREVIYECLKSLNNIKILTIICDSEYSCDIFANLNLKFTESMKSLKLFRTNNKMMNIGDVSKSVKIEMMK